MRNIYAFERGIKYTWIGKVKQYKYTILLGIVLTKYFLYGKIQDSKYL